MGQLLRITFGGKDQNFKLLSALPFDRKVTELELLVNGEKQVIERNADKWRFKDAAGNHELADAIGKAITLRFRIV